VKRVFEPVLWLFVFMLGAVCWVFAAGFSDQIWYAVLMFVPLVGCPLFFLLDTVRDLVRSQHGAHRSE